jgi:hypothetical protein
MNVPVEVVLPVFFFESFEKPMFSKGLGARIGGAPPQSFSLRKAIRTRWVRTWTVGPFANLAEWGTGGNRWNSPSLGAFEIETQIPGPSPSHPATFLRSTLSFFIVYFRVHLPGIAVEKATAISISALLSADAATGRRNAMHQGAGPDGV